ncbi:hypothetical protein [Nocardia sp. NPDC050710]|uniref:hypothetical protein n=1 Tax=Nocardia sp. NPDC050710 TaxID=3157220 RepID=UPI0033E552EF
MSIGGTVRRVSRGWIAWAAVTAGLVALDCAALVWQQASDGDGIATLALLAGAAGCGVMWFVVMLVGAIKYRAFVLSAIAPVLVVGTVLMLWSGVAERAGWRISKGGLEREAVACVESGGPHRVGIYTVSRVRRADGGCLFETSEDLLSQVGFAYLPNGAPAAQHEYDYNYRPYDGPWYRYSW